MSYSLSIAYLFASIAAIIYWWNGPIARLRRDNYRTRIRRIRDDLFDFMVENGYDFTNLGYRETRQLANGFVRMSKMLSVGFVVHLFYLATKSNDNYGPSALDKMEGGPLKEKLIAVRRDILRTAMSFVFRGSIRGWLSMLLFACISKFANEKKSKVERTVMQDAIQMGSDESRSSRMVMVS